MKSILIGILLMANTAFGTEVLAGIKQSAPQAVTMHPKMFNEQTLGEDVLTYTAITNWCGLAVLQIPVGSVEEAYAVSDRLSNTDTIPGTVVTVEKLIFSSDEGGVFCNIQTHQLFSFEFESRNLSGKGEVRKGATMRGKQCEDALKRF